MTAVHIVESVADLAAVMRRARQSATVTQQELADQIGTTRQWLNRFEHANDSVAMLKVLDALAMLGLELVVLDD